MTLMGALAALVISVTPVLAQNTNYNTYGIGNTYGTATQAVSGQSQIVWADGNEVTTCGNYDERSQEIQVFNSGDGSYITNYASTHFDSAPYNVDGRAITGNANYIWASTSTVGTVGRWSRSSRQPAGSLSVTGDPNGYICGLAVRDDFLYVCVPSAGVVVIYNINDPNSPGNYVSQFQVQDGGQLAVDSQGGIWVARVNSPIVDLYQPDGSVKASVTLPGNSSISQISVYSADGQDHLVVADRGSDLDVKVYGYDPANPGAGVEAQGQIGVPGGAFAGDVSLGLVNEMRFLDVKGVSCDPQGNVYVLTQNFSDANQVSGIRSYNGGTLLHRFTRTGTTSWNFAWRDVGLHFEGIGDIDPATVNNGTVDIYTGGERYSFNPSNGQSQFVATLINPFRYPNDPRITSQNDFAFIRRVNGEKILFTTSQSPGSDYFNQPINVFTFNPNTDGEVAIPSGITLNAYTGFSIASNCDIYGVSGNRIYYRPFTGSASNPSWGDEQSWEFNVGNSTSMNRCVFDGNNLYVLAFSDQYGSGPNGGQGLAGRILIRLTFNGGGWSEEARTLIEYQFDSASSINVPNNLTQAGGYVFVGYYTNGAGTPASTRAYSKQFNNDPDNILGPTVNFNSSNPFVYPGNDTDSYYGASAAVTAAGQYIILKDDYNDYKLTSYIWQP